MKKILILLTIFKATLPNACTDMCYKENNAFLRDRCYALAYSAGAISANDLAYNLGQDINSSTDLNYNPSSIVSSLTGSNVASSNAYNFFLDPGYNMFMGNYGMGPTNGSFTTSRSTICSKGSNQNSPLYMYKTIGSNPRINFGSNTFCDTSSVFHPLLVGWAERNIIPNPDSLSNQLFQAPLSLTNTGDTEQDPYFQYLVGDPNCPTPTSDKTTCVSNSNKFTHFKGCRICDQFLYEGVPTINYRYCQYGFNWKYPLYYGVAGGLYHPNLMYYLFWIATLWIGSANGSVNQTFTNPQNTSWWWLSFMSPSPYFEFAPTPIANTNLQQQWGKTGLNNGTNVYNIYNSAPWGGGFLPPCTLGSYPWLCPTVQVPTLLSLFPTTEYPGSVATQLMAYTYPHENYITPYLVGSNTKEWTQFSILRPGSSGVDPSSAYSTLN